MTTKLFGDKEDFAIEMCTTKTIGKFKLGFWIKNKRLGDFKKSGKLNYSIKQYQYFVKNRETFYSPIFDNLTPEEIFYYLVEVFFTDYCEKISFEEVKFRQKFYVFFGDQFANQTGGFLLLYMNNFVIFIVKRPMDGPIENYNVNFEYFCKVFEEYIEYVALLPLT